MGNLNVDAIRRDINIQGVIVSTLTLKIVKTGSYQRFLNYEKRKLIKTQFKQVHHIITPRFKTVLTFTRTPKNVRSTSKVSQVNIKVSEVSDHWLCRVRKCRRYNCHYVLNF